MRRSGAHAHVRPIIEGVANINDQYSIYRTDREEAPAVVK